MAIQVPTSPNICFYTQLILFEVSIDNVGVLFWDTVYISQNTTTASFHILSLKIVAERPIPVVYALTSVRHALPLPLSPKIWASENLDLGWSNPRFYFSPFVDQHSPSYESVHKLQGCFPIDNILFQSVDIRDVLYPKGLENYIILRIK